MCNSEFSDGFDTLLSSYAHSALFGTETSIADVAFDEYEKSLFLTLAQELLLKAFLTGNKTANIDSFDESSIRQLDFSNLISVASFNEVSNVKGFNLNSISLDTSTFDAIFITNEKVDTTEGSYVVVPISYKEYDRLMQEPYSLPLKRQAWRLYNFDKASKTSLTEIILRHDAGNFESYTVRYVRKPKPIILIDLEEGLSIEGLNKRTECELNPSIHLEILNTAVRMALISRGIETQEMKQAKNQTKDDK